MLTLIMACRIFPFLRLEQPGQWTISHTSCRGTGMDTCQLIVDLESECSVSDSRHVDGTAYDTDSYVIVSLLIRWF
jgi:hypothetical protein